MKKIYENNKFNDNINDKIKENSFIINMYSKNQDSSLKTLSSPFKIRNQFSSSNKISQKETEEGNSFVTKNDHPIKFTFSSNKKKFYSPSINNLNFYDNRINEFIDEIVNDEDTNKENLKKKRLNFENMMNEIELDIEEDNTENDSNSKENIYI